MITLKQLSKTYYIQNKPFQALENIDLEIKRGEIYGVLGKSGAGKSTLLRCINLLEKPTSGQVIVNGVDLTLLSLRELREHRHQIGMIFQHFNLLESRTIFDNIALPLEIIGESRSAINKKVTSLLALVGLSHKTHFYPSQLSGGQKQRVGIARALATDPDVLLCDEATSALDSESTQSILSLLRSINRELGITILLITHELDVIKKICDRVGVIHEGRLVEQDTTLNLFAKPSHPISRDLILHTPYVCVPVKSDPDPLIVKLTFLGKDSDSPLISLLVQQFDITINIRQALIEKIQDTTVGYTICQFAGDAAAIKNALNFIQTTSVSAEVLYGTV